MVVRTADGAIRTTRGAEQQSWAALQAMRSVTSSGREVIVSLLEGNRLGRGVFVDALGLVDHCVDAGGVSGEERIVFDDLSGRRPCTGRLRFGCVGKCGRRGSVDPQEFLL